MHLFSRVRTLLGIACLCAAAVANAAELPAEFPSDVPIADYMELINVTVVRDSMMISFHAPDKTIEDVVAWFQSGLNANGWTSEGDHVTARNAILAYKKQGRRCGVSVTNFVMDEAMQMDDSIKGITLQLSGSKAPDEGTTDSAAEATMDAASSN